MLATTIFSYGGCPFLTGGWSEAKQRKPGMMLLIAMAITVVMAAVAGMSFTDGSARQLWLQRNVLPPDFPARPVQAVLTIVVAGPCSPVTGSAPILTNSRRCAPEMIA